ncbi:MAG: bifunctional 5,10-methylenetetrahydrofolate dehydrogenase/5,10-methenyltetrahydrofolate cyclohydrolase, partial [Bacilli bacterium]
MEEIKAYVANKKAMLKEDFLSVTKKPCLAIVQVNEDPGSCAYIRGKLKDLNEIGLPSKLIKLDITTTQNELLKVVNDLNNDESVTGFIVQMPLPKQIDEELVKISVTPKKDVDGFNPLSTFSPATPKGIVTYLRDNGFVFKGKNAVIIGRSNIVGKPMHNLLLDESMNVINLHSKTTKEDMKFYIEHADLIVVAVGKPHFLTNEYNFKKDCIVVDVGINRGEDGHLIGDC